MPAQYLSKIGVKIEGAISPARQCCESAGDINYGARGMLERTSGRESMMRILVVSSHVIYTSVEEISIRSNLYFYFQVY